MHKKIIAIIALICVLVPVWYSLHFIVELSIHRYRMHRQIEQASLETIVLDSATIDWKKKGRELVVNNEYFDVVSIQYIQGKAHIKGVYDKRETQMFAQFLKNQSKEDSPTNGPVSMSRWLLMQWLIPEGHYATTYFYSDDAINPVKKLCTLNNQFAISPPAPPPRIASNFLIVT